jgi:hypothetical protein
MSFALFAGMLCAIAAPLPLTLELVPAPAPVPAAPAFDTEDTLHFDADPDRGVSVNGTYSYGGAARFTATADLRVVAVLYYLTGSADDIIVRVHGQGSEAQPGPELDTVRATGNGGGVWRRANMPVQPLIGSGSDFWTAVIVRRHPSGQSPLTLDLGPMVAWRGGYITLPSIGSDWYQLTDPPFWTDVNFNIRAVVEYDAGVEEVLSAGESCIRFSVEPNPCRPGPVRLEVAGAWPRTGASLRVTVTDISGRKVATRSVPVRANSVDINLGDFSAGVYMVKLSGDGFAVTQRLVVQK